MPTRDDIADLAPYPDENTRAVLNDALEVLGVLRDFPALLDDHQCHDDHDSDYDPHEGWTAFRNEPHLRLHLLASLHQQLQAELLHTTLAARDHGYTHEQIAVLLNHDL